MLDVSEKIRLESQIKALEFELERINDTFNKIHAHMNFEGVERTLARKAALELMLERGRLALDGPSAGPPPPPRSRFDRMSFYDDPLSRMITKNIDARMRNKEAEKEREKARRAREESQRQSAQTLAGEASANTSDANKME